jgi:hypothetical protein
MEKIAFSTGQGLRQFTVMPFGLCNASTTFKRLMETVLRGLTYNACLVYLDDVIVISRTLQEHLVNQRKVFQRFREARLKLNPEKYQLLQKEVRYLRHIVSREGITTDPEKLKAVKEWPTPKNKHEVRSFLGLCTYYRQFISGFPNIAKPLTKLTKQKQSFQWSQRWKAPSRRPREPCVLPRFLPTPNQERCSSRTETPVISGLEECSPKYKMNRSEL